MLAWLLAYLVLYVILKVISILNRVPTRFIYFFSFLVIYVTKRRIDRSVIVIVIVLPLKPLKLLLAISHDTTLRRAIIALLACNKQRINILWLRCSLNLHPCNSRDDPCCRDALKRFSSTVLTYNTAKYFACVSAYQ